MAILLEMVGDVNYYRKLTCYLSPSVLVGLLLRKLFVINSCNNNIPMLLDGVLIIVVEQLLLLVCLLW